MSCGVGCRRGSDPALLWLWRRLVVTALIRPLAWEPPSVAGAAQRNSKRKKKKKKERRRRCSTYGEQTCSLQGEGVGWTGSLGLVDADYYIWSG